MAIDKLVGQTGYEIKKFGDLDVPSQKAIIWYMAIDGEAWDLLGEVGRQEFGDYDGLHRAVAKEIPKYVAKYGNKKFGVASIPADVMKAAWLENMVAIGAYGSWEAYQKATASRALPQHPPTDRWPSILGSEHDEVLQDGWKRCASYMEAGHTDIPVVFYPERRHLKAGAAGPVAPRVCEQAPARRAGPSL
jgi:hypothetical protein